MPAKGKHRRPKSQRFTRSIAVAGTGGAALALPLMGATGAHAATPTATVAKAAEKAAEKTATAAPAAAKKAAGTKTYAVKAGDWLSKIADEQNVSGGWKKLYSDNRSAVGSDPSLIHPGLKLTIGKKAASGSVTRSSAKTTPSSTKSTTSAADTATATTAANTASTSSSSGYTLPVEGATVGTGYKVAGSMWSSGYHTGVDFVVPTGTTIKAIAAGTVVSAGWGGAYGNQVVIQHADGQYSQYAHMSALSVSAGQTVTAGQQIGLSGATGNVTGPHLHFEIRTTPNYGSDVDPVAYLRSHGVAVG
ncbi:MULTISPECIES: LysM peptidoglycan-binding domain-containing M23 family metallopeptidase [unclassified Streptomyces]|uniref:LysM peptidoglycan-binding domain-containing M23 family metallopeptidase n=1 Tax=unclassified Streptomyces TaxID=2593676 RepID=UPI002E81578D|nr:LysM peptidoglycan-binding domain-containing M23 family metallopeptidase [Streptomyces sp. NBC_00589]WTI34466.1 LysM peptidoglycan-binding domain-containing M23 family metallopeptidase [Streptomyces sp. NBC_00775]WUB31861.1 LysM peptidoglycan-binding domain-containing M23 family metallopeptidase [Streptomyces sp. NBC_00589]